MTPSAQSELARPYRPPLFLRNGLLQTLLASLRLRAAGANPMRTAARELILETSAGVRLLGAHSPQAPAPGRGLAILLPGWEGGIDSTYMLCTGRALFRRGFDVFRLNYRDHGRSHHLNRGIFYAVLLDEVFEAVARAAALAAGRPVLLAGFSLGGNFALRIGRRCGAQPIPGLCRIVAVSPALDPAAATARIDRHPLIRGYFLEKWRRSLALKQSLFPELYDFAPALGIQTVMGLTEHLLAHHSPYASAAAYFADYTLTGEALASLRVPASLLTAADDPIVAAADFEALRCGPATEVVVHRHGGHNGFLQGWRLQSRYESDIPELFERVCAGRTLPSAGGMNIVQGDASSKSDCKG
ncbi:MAG: alpha/beta fold hydrolase [Desulfobacterales bacterium]|jgi:hypothetical protein|nr:alpha/beta fold hydrolase [Desulfobacterales bacterium]